MKISEIVMNKIDKFKTKFVFAYKDFYIPVEKIDA